MSNINMWLVQRIIICLFMIIVHPHPGYSLNISSKFSIILQTPDQTSASVLSLTQPLHKSIHVKYTLQDNDEQWNIVGFEPQLQMHQKAIERLTVHLCNTVIHRSIWYDDSNLCEQTPSMLIYEWTPATSFSPLRLPDDSGFVFDRLKTIILSVIYRKEKRIHKEQSGIALNISTRPARFQMGTMLVGNSNQGTHFSCQSSTVPRLLYASKRLITEKDESSWRIHIIRSRQFGRKLVQSVLDSSTSSTRTQSGIDIVASDLFLMAGDYLLVQCDNILPSNCYFLVYFMYKSEPIDYEESCQKNQFPQLFKLIPPRQIFNANQTTTTDTSTIDGSTIFLIILGLLFVAWISTIIGCVIMRRVRGLVNYRTEPVSPLTSQKNKLQANGRRGGNDGTQTRTGDADHIIQIDGEHAGLVG